MNAKIILIISFSALYGLFEIFMSRLYSHKSENAGTGDRGSLWILILSISAGYWLSFMTAATKTGRIYNWNLMIVIGLSLAATGLFLRIKSIMTLGRHFTYTVKKITDHKLIRTGLYKHIRHPGYLAQLIIFLGIAISLSNWISILLMMIPVTAAFLNRIKVEEKFMLLQMGQEYAGYMQKTKKLIPRVY